MTNIQPAPSLFELAECCLATFVAELRASGIDVDPHLELRQSDGRFCYYNLDDGNIYLALPDPSSPVSRLKARLLGASLGCSSECELMAFFRLIVPWLIAHELGHHVRHRYGRFGENLWEEEQVANRLACALTRRRLSPMDRAFAARFLRRALDALSPHVGPLDAATISFHDVLLALNASGTVDDSTAEQMQVARTACAAGPDDFRIERTLGASIEKALAERGEIIRAFNQGYMEDFATYACFHAGWQYIELTHHGAEYVADFARVHLGIEAPLLPPLEDDSAPSTEQVIACFRAYQQLAPRNPTAARYFYRRYRELLWAMLSASNAPAFHPSRARRDTTFFLESSVEPGSDPIGHLAGFAPAALRELFPGMLAQHPAGDCTVGANLVGETDRRLFAYAISDAPDATAEATLDRLALLDQTEVFRSLPAASALELARGLCLVRLRAGETVCWEGDANDDVFCLIEGTADVLVSSDNGDHRVGILQAGDAFGEAAFFHGNSRTATVRVQVASTCIVVKDTELLRIAYRHPSVLMSLGAALAKRQQVSNRKLLRAYTGEWLCDSN